jgi:hypothetical protein
VIRFPQGLLKPLERERINSRNLLVALGMRHDCHNPVEAAQFDAI